MKRFTLVILLLLNMQGSSGLDWNQFVKKSGSTIYACSNDTITFPYLFNLSESESIISMMWTFHDKDVTTMIGNLSINEFVTARNYYGKVIHGKNGNFTMLNVNMKDIGNYILKIQTQDKDKSKQTYTKELSLVVSEHAMYKGSNLIVQLSDKTGWNSDNESLSFSLTCGDFIFKNDNAPIDVEWITPDGSVKNSTKYSDGKFYLQLDNPVKGGQYVCKIQKESLSTVCATSNDNTQVTFSIDEDKIWIIILEHDSKKLKKQIKKIKKNIKKLEEKGEEQDEKLEEQGEKLKEQDGKLEEQGEKLKEQDEKLEEQGEKIKAEDEKLTEQVEKLQNQDDEIQERIASSCEDMKSFGSGTKKIHVTLSYLVKIYCDQDTDGGRWNVFQRRRDGLVDFYKGWSYYRNGFGDPDREFWLGLETLHRMTNAGLKKFELRFDLEAKNGSKYYAVYDNFSIGSERENYAVHFTGYKGNAGDSFTYQKDMQFTTIDRDNDKASYNCAVKFMGAWWHKSCHWSNMNGHYDDNGFGRGLNWRTLIGYEESLKATEMKFRIKQ